MSHTDGCAAPIGGRCYCGRPAEPTEELREALARTLSTWVIGVAYENNWTCADRLLSGPLAPLLAAQAAVQRVEELAEELASHIGTPDVHRANEIRRALDGTP